MYRKLFTKLLVIPLTLQAKSNNFTATELKPIVVAVIDSGINPSLSNKISLCKFGSKDFTGTDLIDRLGHGSHIAGLIDANAKATDIYGVDKVHINYCQITLKIWNLGEGNPLANELKALRWAINLKVDVINFSGVGDSPNNEEAKLIALAVRNGIKVVVSAGNEGKKMVKNSKTGFYPAMYPIDMFVVGNLDSTRKPANSSNYGKMVNTWEIGMELLSFCPHGDDYCVMSGTSQATAVKSGKMVRKLLK
jgi:subtilisin family serine protease